MCAIGRHTLIPLQGSNEDYLKDLQNKYYPTYLCFGTPLSYKQAQIFELDIVNPNIKHG